MSYPPDKPTAEWHMPSPITDQRLREILMEECAKQGLGGTRFLDRRAIKLFDDTVAAALAAMRRATEEK